MARVSGGVATGNIQPSAALYAVWKPVIFKFATRGKSRSNLVGKKSNHKHRRFIIAFVLSTNSYGEHRRARGACFICGRTPE